tara:strand:- start:519 stop:1646 length:1128 start_codon:yes stop_codon:yes gene_type:complete
MKVFFDTNVFYGNWFASNVNFKLLFYFLNNEDHSLLLSELVVQEVNNIRDRELKQFQAEFSALIKKGNKLSQKLDDISIICEGIETYDLTKILKSKVDSIAYISYETIPQRKVVDRAISNVKPFSNQEKGYRDTLIWLSFLEYLKVNNIEGEVAFITNNKSDFFRNTETSLEFDKDLAKDIEEYGIKANIKPYLNIYAFVTANVDKASNLFDRRNLLDDIEDTLIEETKAFLDGMSNYELSLLLDSNVFSEKLTSVIRKNSEVYEGLEDSEIKEVKLLPGKSVYISSYFEMRTVTLIVTIENVEFKQHVDEIEAIDALYNIDLNDDYVELSFGIRPSIHCSFEYETEQEYASNFSIEHLANAARPKKYKKQLYRD